MVIKLCYKEYNFKITLASCKSFYDATGEDLQYILLQYIDKCRTTVGQDLLIRMNALLGVCNFETAAQAIHSLVKTENTSVSIDEIRDGMFRVSWMPSERSDDLSEPWSMVMLTIATQVNDYFNNNIPVKKKGTKAKGKT